MNMENTWQRSMFIPPVRRKIFVSYHHGGDQGYYDLFSRTFGDTYDIIYDNSLERSIDSDDPAYVMRRIRENYITGSSCTIVLVGHKTSKRKYVDWEIMATLEKQHGLIGIHLPTARIENNLVIVPDRLHDNIQSGYALWVTWSAIIQNAQFLPEQINVANDRSMDLIRNDRDRMQRNL